MQFRLSRCHEIKNLEIIHRGYLANFRRGSKALSYPRGGLFGDHQGGGIGIAAGDGWHDARIDYAQSLHTFDTQMRIQNRCGIVHLAHFYRANRVENCISDITGEPRQFFVAFVLHPALILLVLHPGFNSSGAYSCIAG